MTKAAHAPGQQGFHQIAVILAVYFTTVGTIAQAAGFDQGIDMRLS